MPTSTITNFLELCRDYLQDVQRLRATPSASPELSLRTALNNFLDRAAVHLGRQTRFINEGSGAPKGRPDFVLSLQGQTIGYVEAEKPDANLAHLTGHTKTQNDGFKANLDNFLLTNHFDFRLYDRGEEVERATLPEDGSVTQAQADKLEALLDRLTRAEPPAIASPRDLAFYLARRTRTLRDAVRDMFRDSNDAPGGELQDAFEAFKKVLLPELKPYLSDEERGKPKRPHAFDDIYAQTLAYGLFAARFAHKSGMFSPPSAARYLSANPFLRQLFARFMSDLPGEIAWIADDMARVLAPDDAVEVVTREFARRDETDPLLHFYEPFLREYDPAMQDARGVYYTPPAVVSYIVRSVHRLLQTRFHCPDGLATHDYLPPQPDQTEEQYCVQILDPATGTGSFLFSVVENIYEHVSKVGGWASYVNEHLRPRLLGFELIVAPYVVAHLKLGLLLESLGTPTTPDAGRWQIFLTNTLEPPAEHPQLPGSNYITQEVERANEVKAVRPILVVLGNPPYKGHSSNILTEGSAVQRRHRSYYFVDGKPLGERNPKLLQDDYVKFIAFAQERIAQTGEGIVAYIMNHGYIDNITFRGLRRALMQTFNDIYVFDLHGNSRKREQPPEGGTDKNVFDIQQGVAIIFGVKEKDNDALARVHYAELWGERAHKYQTLRDSDIDSTSWQQIQPEEPAYYFMPLEKLSAEYKQGVPLLQMFGLSSTGVKTHRDHFVVALDTDTIERRINDFRDMSIDDATIRQRYDLDDTSSWSLSSARRTVSGLPNHASLVTTLLYRPFDLRPYFHHASVVDRPRDDVMKHLRGDVSQSNLALVVGRQGQAVGSHDWEVCFVSSHIVDQNIYRRGSGQVFPLYLSPSEMEKQMGEERRPNFSVSWLRQLSEAIGCVAEAPHSLPQGVSAEEVFAYIYAVLHAPTYRARYAPFLRIDFPRVPLPRDAAQFAQLGQLGWQLIALHTLDAKAAPVLNEPRHKFNEGEGNVVVKARVRHDENTKRVTINGGAWFEDVEGETWAFRVGGYTPAERWLKERDGRALTYDDQAHYRRLLIAQSETLLVLPAIDAALGLAAGEADDFLESTP